MDRTTTSFILSTSLGNTSLDRSPVSNLSTTVQQSWQQIHDFLITYAEQVNSGSELCGLTLYYYHVYKSFGQVELPALVQNAYSRLLSNMQITGLTSWDAEKLEQVRTVAWLTAQLVQDGLLLETTPAVLRFVDAQLMKEAHQLLGRTQLINCRTFIHILHYFNLRSVPHTETTLQELLHAWSKRLEDGIVQPEGVDLKLSLTDGLSGDLLLLLQLYKTGSTSDNIQRLLQVGIQQVLATRQEVDFGAGHYAIFPRCLQAPYHEALFSTELTWAHGDLGHSWLLYEAHNLWQDAELARIAELVGLNTLLRTSSSTTEVRTASFFQGSAGVAHLYRRLYYISGHEAYRKAYNYWLGQTLEWLNQELPYPPKSSVFSMRFGLVGVALLLLAEVTDQKMDWDTLLL